MKKFFKNAIWFSKLALVSCCLLVAACDDDDDSQPNQIQNNGANYGSNSNGGTANSVLVGVWKYTFSSGWCQLVFNSDGTGSYMEYDEADHDSVDPFRYSYDSSKGDLYLYFDEGYGNVETDYYKVISIADGVMEVWYDGDSEEREVYYKQ